MDAVQDLCEGEFVWTDEVDLVHGLPVVEWSLGFKTVLPKYDWQLDYSGILPTPPQDPAQKKRPRKDHWKLHVFGLPIKPAHAMTYHDSQGQTC